MLSMSPGQTTPIAQGHQALSYVSSPPSAHALGFKRPLESDEEPDVVGNDGRIQQQGRRQAAVKRACNECRQQKLKCNVQQDPFQACSRCVKHKLNCIIEPHFKRIGKRSRNAEMEREMADLRQKLAQYEGSAVLGPQPTLNTPRSTSENGAYSGAFKTEEDDAYLQTQHQAVAASSLLELRSGSPMFHSLGDVRLGSNQIGDLYREFFLNYHPFLPFLDPLKSPDEYAKESKLLFWAIVSIAARHYEGDSSLLGRLKEPLMTLIWHSAMKNAHTQNYQLVKALCLICTWPLPTSRTSTDPTFMLCGLMMQIAMQIGLHQPMHPQDFSRTKLRMRQEDISDRMTTWVVCNIVAQTVSTGYGQPSFTIYNSILDFKRDNEENIKALAPDLFARLRQELAAGRITRILYAAYTHRRSEKPGREGAQGTFYANLEADRLLEELGQLDGVNTTLENLHHSAVNLHLRLYAFFDTESVTPDRNDLLQLYFAAIGFLQHANKLLEENRLKYVPYYIMQMILAAGFALLKILNSEFAAKVNYDEGRRFVYRTIEAMRKSRIEHNDLLDRFAEVLAQLWKASSSGRSVHSMTQSPAVGTSSMSSMLNQQQQQQQQQQQHHQAQSQHVRRDSAGILDNPLRLMIRSRMSMSVVFDCIWRWRESQVNGADEQLDTTVVHNPTNPDSSNNSTPPPGSVMQEVPSLQNAFNSHLSTLSMPLALPNGLASVNSFEMFDSMSWMLDTQQPEWNTYPGFSAEFGGI